MVTLPCRLAAMVEPTAWVLLWLFVELTSLGVQSEACRRQRTGHSSGLTRTTAARIMFVRQDRYITPSLASTVPFNRLHRYWQRASLPWPSLTICLSRHHMSRPASSTTVSQARHCPELVTALSLLLVYVLYSRSRSLAVSFLETCCVPYAPNLK